MSGRHFDNTEDAQLRAKIDEAKRRLPLPELMRQLGYDEKHIGKTAVCAGDQFSPNFGPQVASKTAGSIKTAGDAK
jgi:hypothetical protein